MSNPLSSIIINRDDHCVSRKNISSAALKVLYRLHDKGFKAYLAGGAVRDLILNIQPNDFDIVTNATPLEIKKIFKNCRIVGRRFTLAHIFFKGEIIETSTFRAPITKKNSNKKNTQIMTANDGLVVRDNLFGTPEEDALRRDFTVNALFYDPINFTIIDYANGLNDVKLKKIKTIGSPQRRFIEDPVRMIRAVRFASTLSFNIDKKDFHTIKKNAYLIQNVSSSRMYDEMQKLFFSGSSNEMYKILEESNLLKYIFVDFYKWVNEDSKRLNWINSSLNQLDKWINAGLKVDAPLLFALIFGEYHEAMIEKKIDNNKNTFDLTRRVINDHLNSICSQIRIPKTIIYQVCDIMTHQIRFKKMNPKQSSRIAQSTGFINAFLYLKFSSKILLRNENVLYFWQEIRNDNSLKITSKKIGSQKRITKRFKK